MKIDLNFINVINKQITWQESIELSAFSLLENNYITQNYIKSIFSSIKELGMYIIIDPKIALPHSRPENGAIKTGISILKSNFPITFSDAYKEVKLVITFSSFDNTSHIQLLTELSEVLSNEDTLNKILNSTTKEEIWSIINEKN